MGHNFLDGLREKRETKTSMIQTIVDRAADETRDVTEVELANIEALNLEVKKLDERIEQISDMELRNAKAADLAAKVDSTKPASEKREAIKVVSEPTTYSQRSEYSFLADAVKAHFNTDVDAADRIRRHQQEMNVEYRAAGTSNFGGLVVPQYLVDLYAPKLRAGRPFADASRRHTLPPQGMSVVLSLIGTGTGVAAQTSQNTAAVSTDPQDSTLTINVNTVAGQNSVSKQALLRGYNL